MSIRACRNPPFRISTALLLATVSPCLSAQITPMQSGGKTFTKGLTPFDPVHRIYFADEYPGEDCGAKIAAAFDAAGSPGVVEVSPACGPWSTPLTLRARQVLRLRPGIYSVGAMITLAGTSASLQGPPNSDSPGGDNGSAVLQEAAGSNLAHLLLVAGVSDSVSNLVVDGQQFDSILDASLTAAGSGYTSAPRVTVTGCASAPVISARLSGTTVGSIAITDGFFSGAGCSGELRCSIAGGGGHGATCRVASGGNGNPRGGTLVEVRGLRAHFENATITRSPSHGLHAGDGGSAPVFDQVAFLENQGDGALFQDITDPALENLTVAENNRGWGVELWNAAGSRFQNGDLGGNRLGGERICGIAAGYTATGTCGTDIANHVKPDSNIIDNVQCGFNNGPDVEIDGYDAAHVDYVSRSNTVSHLKIIGSAYRTDNLYPAIKIVDSGGNIVVGNSVIDSPGHRYSAGISITESVAGRELPDVVAANNVPITLQQRAIVGVPNTVYSGNFPGEFPGVFSSLHADTVTVRSQKARSGKRYACFDTNGTLVASVTPCNGS